MNYNKLQSLLPNDELHYNDSNKSEFILYEFTIDNFDTTIEILNNNNIKLCLLIIIVVLTSTKQRWANQ